MVMDDLHLTMPSHFRCPISLDIMKSPVSLSTGVTYDRASIQRWLDAGNNTCPATMQLLPTKDLTPNHTLQRLIQIWSDSYKPPQTQTQTISTHQANQLLHRLHDHLSLKHSSFLAQNLSVLTSFAAQSEENAAFLAAAAAGILPAIISLAGKVRDLVVLEKIVSFCNIVLLKYLDSEALRSKIDLENFDFKLGVLLGLKQGRAGLRNALVKFLQFLAKHKCVEINLNSISEDDNFHRELLKLITSSDSEAGGAALSLLIRSAQSKRNRARIVRAGGVAAVAAAMGEKEKEMGAASIEKMLRLLEMLTGSKEGRNEICGGDGNCVTEVVKKLLKVSGAATEHAVAVLWSLCCLHGDKRAAAAVVEGNGMGKVLVVMQSGCSPAVRRMCADLLRVLRCGSKTTAISWYDTKTTHIMPF